MCFGVAHPVRIALHSSVRGEAMDCASNGVARFLSASGRTFLRACFRPKSCSLLHTILINPEVQREVHNTNTLKKTDSRDEIPNRTDPTASPVHRMRNPELNRSFESKLTKSRCDLKFESRIPDCNTSASLRIVTYFLPAHNSSHVTGRPSASQMTS